MGKTKLKRGFYWRNGVIWIRSDPVTGKRSSTRCHDARAAESWRDERERLAANPAHLASLSATIGEWVMRTLKNKQAQRSAGTVHMYGVKLGHVVRLFGKAAPLASITPGAVDDYITTRSGEGAVNNTIQRELVCIRQMLRLAKRAGFFAGDIDQVMPVGFSAGYKPRTRVLKMTDLPALWGALRTDRERAFVALVLATGADLGDVPKATPADYDPVRQVMRIRGTKTTTRDGEVPILPHVRELFAFALENMPIDWPHASKRLGDACKRAGIPHLSPKDLRRTAASLLVAGGADISLVSRFMRHGSDAMVRKVYGQVQPEELGSLLATQTGTLASHSLQPLGETGRRRGLKRPDGAEETGPDSDICPERSRVAWRVLARPVAKVSTPASHVAFAAERLGLGAA